MCLLSVCESRGTPSHVGLLSHESGIQHTLADSCFNTSLSLVFSLLKKEIFTFDSLVICKVGNVNILVSSLGYALANDAL